MKSVGMGTKPKGYQGPALLAAGYRIFFLSAALWAVTSLVLWLLYISSMAGELGGSQNMLAWHAHELVYGYGGAVVAGFALTAIPNWTGRTPIRGFELGLLFAPWLIARISAVMLLYGFDTDAPRAVAETGFFGLFVLFATREVVAGKNWRNLKVVGLFLVLAIAAVAANFSHFEVIQTGILGWQMGLLVLLLLICVIGGRIIPAFTGNWMRQQGHTTLPTMFGKFDVLAIAAAVAVLVAYSTGAHGQYLAVAAGLTGALHFVRLMRWRGWQTLASPIVVVLHVSYLWVPIGFLLMAFWAMGWVSDIAALHAWSVGGIGSTTLAVMTRASLGHSGLPLKDSAVLTTIYAAINVAALTRVLAGVWYDYYELFLSLSGVMWCGAFLLFVGKFAPVFFKKTDAAP